jgi:rod shape-determining protein MreC
VAVGRRTSQRLTLVMLVLASVTIITLDYRGDAKGTIGSIRDTARDSFAPVQSVIADVLHPIGDLFSGALHYGTVQAENEELQQELAKEQRLQSENSVAEQQLSQLLQQQHLPFVENIPTLQAQIIEESTSNFDDEIEIDLGTANGIGPGEPVAAAGGLVGAVVSASSSTAMVRLITDARSGVGVRFGDNVLAVANGGGPGEPITVDVQSGATVTMGETVYTSGLLPAAYPADIPVGTVSSVQTVPGAFTTVATVQPFVDFDTLQYVTVMQWLPPA